MDLWIDDTIGPFSIRDGMLMKINGCMMQLPVASWAAKLCFFIVCIGVPSVFQGVNISKST